jgi:glycosyltransferase involved in cell wall biosynthesis
LAYFMAAPFAAHCMCSAGVTHLHAHFANAATTTAMMVGALTGIPFSFTAHAYDIFVDDVLLAKKLAAAAFVATCSHFHVRYFREHYATAAQAAIFVVRYGLDPERFALQQPSQRTPPLIIAVGRLVETKGFHTLIEACARLRAMPLTVDCLIIGDGPERERLTQMIRDLQLTDRVTLFGKLPPTEVAASYGQAALLAMPSCVRNNNRDGIPNVLLEAMATGLSVVSTRVSGIPELVRHEETGLLVEPDDPEALANAIARLLTARPFAERLARAGRDLVLREYNIERSARQLQRLFAGERDFREEN